MQNQLQKLLAMFDSQRPPLKEAREYIQYSAEVEQTLRYLEAHLHESDDPVEIAQYTLKTACKFYGGDWCGLFVVDLDLKLWSPYWWYNDSVEDKTTSLLHELESADFLYRWVRAFRANEPMIVLDAEAVKKDYPDEYDLYQRLGINSVLAVPVCPRPSALIAVRNMTRYQSQTSMLRLLAYVLLVAYNEQKTLDRLQLAVAPENIKSSKDVYISLFGELKIYTSNGVLKESIFNSPRISRLLTYLLISHKAALTPYEIEQTIWPGDSANFAKNLKNLIYRLRQLFMLISDEQLIQSSAVGYQFNPNLNIMTDCQRFDSYMQAAAKASSIMTKVELLKGAIDLYNGKVLASADGEHWLIQFATQYHLAYIGAVNELLKQLDSLHAYDLLNQYAMKSLTIAPENTRGYYWLIRSLKAQGMDELASNEYHLAKQHLTTDEYSELLTSLADNQESFS